MDREVRWDRVEVGVRSNFRRVVEPCPPFVQCLRVNDSPVAGSLLRRVSSHVSQCNRVDREVPFRVVVEASNPVEEFRVDLECLPTCEAIYRRCECRTVPRLTSVEAQTVSGCRINREGWREPCSEGRVVPRCRDVGASPVGM